MNRLILIAALAALGCQPQGGQDGGASLDSGLSAERRLPPQPLPLAAFSEAAPAAFAGAAPGVRFVAISDQREGPDYVCALGGTTEIRRNNGRFRVGHLYLNSEELLDEERVELAAVPLYLRRYCLVEWEPDDGEQLPTAASVAAARAFLDRFPEYGEDLQVAGSQAADLEAVVWTELATRWRTALDELRPLPSPRMGTRLTPIRIAVADTSPRSDTGEANDGRSDHGLAMGRLAKVLSCPQGPAGSECPGFVAHHLALPRIHAVARPNLGGFYGYQGEIAVAVGEAVNRWLVAPPEDGRAHLVINLSLGWDGAYGGAITTTPQADLKPPVRAVYEAMVYAACQGALVVAAAGNRSGGPLEVPGPLFPAGWEVRSAPNAATCQLFGVANFQPSALPYSPLVHSVGGVRGDDYGLANSRPGGRPRLVAPAFQAVVGVVDSGGGGTISSGVNSGSSVAAAAVSGIAATLWSYRPGLTAHEVMQALYDGGVVLSPSPEGLGVLADYCLGGPCPGARRVSMCQAWQAVCNTGMEACDPAAVVCNDTPPAWSGTLNALEPLLAAMLADVTAAGAAPTPLDGNLLNRSARPPRACDYATGATIQRVNVNRTLAAGCPIEQFPLREAAPWAAPQPWGGVCPTCMAITTIPGVPAKGDVYLYTSPTFAHLSFFDGLITFRDVGGKVLSSVPLKDFGISSFKGGENFTLNSVVFPAGFKTVSLETLTYLASKTKPGTYDLSATLDELAWW